MGRALRAFELFEADSRNHIASAVPQRLDFSRKFSWKIDNYAAGFGWQIGIDFCKERMNLQP
jgi:hypothetical protein